MRLKLRRRDGTIGRFKKDHRSLFSQSADGDLFRSGESQKVGMALGPGEFGGVLKEATGMSLRVCVNFLRY